MAMSNSKLEQSLPEAKSHSKTMKPLFSYGFPMVFLRFSYGFPIRQSCTVFRIDSLWGHLLERSPCRAQRYAAAAAGAHGRLAHMDWWSAHVSTSCDDFYIYDLWLYSYSCIEFHRKSWFLYSYFICCFSLHVIFIGFCDVRPVWLMMNSLDIWQTCG